MQVQHISVITCPNCGFDHEQVMPTDACQFFYRCPECETVLRPLEGDCCVFCSYGTVPCPPIQQSASCGSAPANHQPASVE